MLLLNKIFCAIFIYIFLVLNYHKNLSKLSGTHKMCVKFKTKSFAVKRELFSVSNVQDNITTDSSEEKPESSRGARRGVIIIQRYISYDFQTHINLSSYSRARARYFLDQIKYRRLKSLRAIAEKSFFSSFSLISIIIFPSLSLSLSHTLFFRFFYQHRLYSL